jgi:hypothetical protein
MEATELRIGNLIIDKEFPSLTSTIEEIGFNWITASYDDGQDVSCFEPIPLTENWLTKFGFNSKYKSVHTHWNIKWFGLDQKADEDDEGNRVELEEVFYYDYRLEVKYVHQLQNLYFALTGEELKYE